MLNVFDTAKYKILYKSILNAKIPNTEVFRILF